MVKSRLLGAVGIVAIVGGVLMAQTPASPAFEAASVKQNKSSGGAFVIVGVSNQNAGGGRFSATNVSLQQLIANVYQLPDIRIIGEPKWFGIDHFDSIARRR